MKNHKALRFLSAIAVFVLVSAVTLGCSLPIVPDAPDAVEADGSYLVDVTIPLAAQARPASPNLFDIGSVTSIAITVTWNTFPYTTIAIGSLARNALTSTWTGKITIPDGTEGFMIFQASAKDLGGKEIFFGDKETPVSGATSIIIPMNPADTNNDSGTAVSLFVDEAPAEGFINSPTDVDYYSVDLTAGTSYDITLSDIPVGVMLTLGGVINGSFQLVTMVG